MEHVEKLIQKDLKMSLKEKGKFKELCLSHFEISFNYNIFE
jgi:hypothetical protein